MANTLEKQHSMHAGRTFKLFAGSGGKELAPKVAEHLGMKVGALKLGRFSDGEIQIQVEDNVRNEHVFVIQSTCPPVNENLMELLLLVRTFKRASARTITAVIPYFGYARQDRKIAARVPISASDVAMFLETAGVDRVLAVDLHCGQIQGFFHNAPVDNLTSMVEMVPYVAHNFFEDVRAPICVVSPDAGGVARAKMFLEGLVHNGCGNVQLAITVKHRATAGVVESMNVVGDVSGRHCIIVDDIIDTAGTLCKSADTLLELGALSVSACVTHAVFSGPALERIASSKLKYLLISDTIPLSPNAPANIKQVSVASLIATAIRSINDGLSVSSLFSI